MQIKHLTLGEGRPKICVPLVSSSLEALTEECEELRAVPFDLLEWRIDYLLAGPDFHYEKDLPRAFACLRAVFPEAVVLTTLRTKSQGGCYDLSDASYGVILHFLLENHLGDVLDVEYGHEDLETAALFARGKEIGLPLLMSFHRFDGALSEAELLSIYQGMQSAGADILKIAVMPKTAKDTAALFTAAATMREGNPQTPVIAIGMGALGVLTRLAGNDLGGPLTFAAGQAASAPGQLTAQDEKRVIELLYGSCE